MDDESLLERLNGTPPWAPRAELREARMAALADAEDYGGVLHAIERLGQLLNNGGGGLGDYREVLIALAMRAYPLSTDRAWHTPPCELFEMMRCERNAAQHVGARARGLVEHVTQFSLLLEDGLVMSESPPVSDFMVRTVICAELWQPVSFVRQTILQHQFSALPVKWKDTWRFIRDVDLAAWLRSGASDKLARRLRDALDGHGCLSTVKALCVKPGDTTTSVIDRLVSDQHSPRQGVPALVIETDELRGVVSAYDIL